MSVLAVISALYCLGCIDPRDEGALPGGRDNYKVNTDAIQRSFGKASAEKGCVTLVGGDYYAADLVMGSDVEFTVGEGTRLLTTINQTKTALLLVYNATNVTIRGPGEINGRAQDYIESFSPQDDRFNPSLPDGSRPRLLKLLNSNMVTLEGFTLRNASDWTLHIQGSKNVLVDDLTIVGDSRFPNNDGIDPESSVNVTIRNSNIDVADDGICPKSRSGYGPLRNLTVSNCTIRSKSHAIKFGTNTDEDMFDIVFDNITIHDSNGGLSVQQRSGGNIYNVLWKNIVIKGTRYESPRWWGNGDWLVITSEKRNNVTTVGSASNMTFINITVDRTENGGLLSGRDNGVSDIHFENIFVTVNKWSNYSNGERCGATNAGSIPCMGSLDYRPSLIEDKNCSTCRTPSKLHILNFASAHNITTRNVVLKFADIHPPSYWGNRTCVGFDPSYPSSNVDLSGVTCLR